MTDKPEKLSRRGALVRSGLLAGAALAGKPANLSAAPAETAAAPGDRFTYCLNAATLSGHKISLVAKLELASKVGYTAVEPWVAEVHDYAKAGGSLKDLGQRIRDLGLTVESAIAFFPYLVDDDATRAKGLEQAKFDMDALVQIGGKRIAAPPAGATNEPGLDLHKAAERYRVLLELGDQMGVVPELEVWGFSQNIRHLSEAAFVALETHHPKACIVADVFHLHKGGSDFDGLRMFSGEALPVLHMNDYPAEPGPDKIDDSFRVYPGDGVAPFPQILRTLHENGGRTVLSLELFNREYWKQDPELVARTGLEKMKALVAKAIA